VKTLGKLVQVVLQARAIVSPRLAVRARRSHSLKGEICRALRAQVEDVVKNAVNCIFLSLAAARRPSGALGAPSRPASGRVLLGGFRAIAANRGNCHLLASLMPRFLIKPTPTANQKRLGLPVSSRPLFKGCCVYTCLLSPPLL
jgi:hypothetical protein